MSICLCQTTQGHIQENRNFGNAARTSNLIYSSENPHIKRHPLLLVFFFLFISLTSFKLMLKLRHINLLLIKNTSMAAVRIY